MTRCLLFLLLISCSALSTRKIANDELQELHFGPENCNLLLKKLTITNLPMLKDQALASAIEDMKSNGTNFSQEELFTIQWSSSLSLIITDEYVTYFLGQELKGQGLNLKDPQVIAHFLNKLDSNQLLGLVRSVAKKFISSFLTPFEILDPKQSEKVAKALHLSIDQLKTEQYHFTETVIQNPKIVEISILLRLKNRQQFMAQNLKSYEQSHFQWLNLPLLSDVDQNADFSKIVVSFTPQNVFRVYTDEAYFYQNDTLMDFIERNHTSAKKSFPALLILTTGNRPVIKPSFYLFLSSNYKKITLKQFDMLSEKFANINFENYPYLKEHLQHLRKMASLTKQLKDSQESLKKYPWDTEVEYNIPYIMDELQKYFNQMEYLFE